MKTSNTYFGLTFFVLLVVFSFLGQDCFCEESVFEDFSNGLGGFSEDEFSSVSDGKLYFKGDRSDNVWGSLWNGGTNPSENWNPQPGHSDYFEDFYVSADVFWESGAEDYSYGLIFCYEQNNETTDLIIFGITMTGMYAIDEMKDGDHGIIASKWSDSLIKTAIGAKNNLSVAKNGDKFSFYINDIKIEQLTLRGFSGGGIGVYGSHYLDASFDCFTISPTDDPGWLPIQERFAMDVHGEAFIDKIKIEKAGYIIGAFGPDGTCDCRGRADIVESSGKWLYDLPIVSDTEGEEITFKIWDSNKCQLHHVNDTIDFKSDASVQKDIGKPLRVKSADPNLAMAGEDLEVTLTGDEFDKDTRVSMSLDIGNKMKIIGSMETPGFAWGITVVENIAYIACGNWAKNSDSVWSGLQIIDITTPSKPEKLGSLATPGHANDVEVVGNIAYVACGDSHDQIWNGDSYENRWKGLQIMDVSDPYHPRLVGSVETEDDVDDVVIMGNKAYLASGNNFKVADISNPSTSEIIGTVGTGPFGIAMFGDTAYVSGGAVVGNMAYVEDWDDDFAHNVRGLRIIDIEVPSDPKALGFTDIMGSYIGAIKVVENIAYVPYGQMEGGGGLQAIDVTNPSKPVTIGSVNTGFSNSLTVVGNMAYLACGDYIDNQWNGLQIVDVSNLHNPNMPGNIGIPLNSGSAYDLEIVGNIVYLTSSFDLQVVDVSNPVKPVVMGSTYLDFGGDWIEVHKDVAYVRGWDNIEVIDISNPYNPENIGYVDIPANGIATMENIAYVAASNELKLLDISNPSKPEPIGSVNVPGSAVEVEVVENIAYVGYWIDDEWHGGLQLVDIGNPSSLKLLGSVDVPVEVAKIKIIGNIAYVAGGMGGLHIIDIDNPLHPEIIASIPTQDIAVDVEVVGNLAYIIDLYSGLQTIDIANPLEPVIIASIDTPGRANGIEVIDNIAYITDWGKGLIIVPVPIESKSVTVNSETNISVIFPEVHIPGHYTLRVFNGKEYDELPGAVTLVPPEESYLLDTKAIIVAGGGPDAPGNIWDETRTSADYAYETLLYQGYTAESIYYLSPDTDSPGVDGDATYQNLSYAINTWPGEDPPATELLIFFVDHGEAGGFLVNEKEKLGADELNNWLNDLQAALPIPVTFIYDACYSGTFIEQLRPDDGRERAVLTSTLPDQQALFIPGGLNFSYPFWNAVYGGDGIGRAFSRGRKQMEAHQTAVIDANGNGIGNEPEDEQLANELKIRRGYRPVTDIPYIYSVSDVQTLNSGETSAELRAGISYADEDTEIRRVWAVITPPNFVPESPDVPITDLPTVELRDTDNDSVYEGVYDKFAAGGEYAVSIYAMNDKGVYSLPRETAVIKSHIVSISDPQVLKGENSARLWAKTECEGSGIAQVRAEITLGGRTDELLLEDPDGDCVFENIYNRFSREGTYSVAVYVRDAEGNDSLPGKTTVTRENDTSDSAGIVVINSGAAQHHDFYYKGDEDWSKILGSPGQTYVFEAENLGSISDAVIEIYDTDGRTLLKRTGNQNTGGRKVSLHWDCPREGIYFVRVRNLNPDYFGENAAYNFRVYHPTAPPFPGDIQGIITDAASGRTVTDVRITTDGGGTALSRPLSGAYTVIQEAGTVFMNVEACGYEPVNNLEVLIEEGGTTSMNIALEPDEGFGGYYIDGGICIKAVIHAEGGPIKGVWKPGGEGTTDRGDRVVWGHFHADPDDVSWGSEDNPDLFVKIWFDAGGRTDVNFFHVSVPDIEVFSDDLYDDIPGERGTVTLDRRYIRHYYENSGSGSDEQYENGEPLPNDQPSGDPDPSSVIGGLDIGAIINTENQGAIEAVWKTGGSDITDRGDIVVWGHFYAHPADVSWGSPDNPDLFVKIWYDVSGRTDVNFFHVSVPDIEVFSDLPAAGEYDGKGTTAMRNRYIRHEYR